MITAYFDATYNHPTPNNPKPILHTLAAYFGTDESWKKFRKEWRQELGRKGLPFFHMTDFEFARSQVIAGREVPRRSLYREWSKDELEQFQRRLHQVINRKDSNGIYRLENRDSAVLKSDFDETLSDELKGDVQCCTYYIFNVVQILKGIRLWADSKNYHDQIHYVFAAGDGEDGNLERLFLDMWNDPVPKGLFRLSTAHSDKPYSIEKMKEQPSLQAADIAAYEMHKGQLEWIKRGFVDIPKYELRKSLGSLARTTHLGWVYTKKQLVESFEEIVIHNKNRQFMPQIKGKKFS